MTAAQLAELFQPFNRLGRERSAQQGTGIGLVISQRLAELMGGTLRARSVAGEGSSFILTLPRGGRTRHRALRPRHAAHDVDRLPHAASCTTSRTTKRTWR